jgi:AraC family transcriptional regulator
MTLFTVDPGQQSGKIQLFPRLPLLMSQLAQWDGVHLEYHHQPPYEIPESSVPQHIVAIQTEVSAPRQIEGYLGGQFQKAEFAEGDILLIPANMSHQAKWQTEHQFILLSLEPNYLTQVANDSVNLGQVELIPHFLKSDPLIYHLGLTLKAELEINDWKDRLYVETLIRTLAVHLLKHYSIYHPQTRQSNSGLSQSELRQVIHYIHDRLEWNLNLSELASVAHLSVSHFSVEFKRLTGLSPYQYVLQHRVERAKQLLIESQDSIAEIARQAGFANQGHLSLHFKRHYGVTPGTVRRKS